MHMCNFCSNFVADLKLNSMKRIACSLLLTALFGLYGFAALPEVTLRDVAGNNVDIASLAQSGKPVIISFFATWCKPCVRELKAIDDLYPEWCGDVYRLY